MPARAEDSGIVDTEPKEVAVLAVHVLERLGYRVNRHSKKVGEIIAALQLNEQIGRDWFRSDYQVVLAFRKAKNASSLVSVEVTERTGVANSSECAQRAEDIIVRLQQDAQRAVVLSAEQEKSTIHGSARWGTEHDLRAAGYIIAKPKPTQLIIGKISKDEYVAVPERVSFAHGLVVGRTGVGKTTGFFIPNIVERLGVNMVITEATPDYGPGELFKLTAGWRKNAGHQVLSFNPAVMSSTRLNPIDRVRNAPEHYKAREAERLADLVVVNGERQGTRTDPAFDRSEKHLLMSLILHCAATDPERGHFGALRWLLLSGVTQVKRTMMNSPSEVAQMEFEGWLRDTSEGFRFSVTAGLKTKLNPWLTDQTIVLTQTTDIDFEALKNQLFTFYIAVPNRSRDSQLLGSLMVNYLLDYILDEGEKMKYRTAFLLDEFTNFGRIANIEDTLSIVRKARVGLVMGFQNYYQLEKVYGRTEAQIIFDQPATQIFFQQKKFKEAKDLSEALGRTTVEETTVSDSGRIMESVMGRNLATADELMRLERHCIAFTNDTPALKLPVIAPDTYQLALAYPAPEAPEHEVTEFIRRRGRSADKSATAETGGREPKERTRSKPDRSKNRATRKRQVEREQNDTEQERGSEGEPVKPDMGDVW